MTKSINSRLLMNESPGIRFIHSNDSLKFSYKLIEVG